jgi:hypothetical protein
MRTGGLFKRSAPLRSDVTFSRELAPKLDKSAQTLTKHHSVKVIIIIKNVLKKPPRLEALPLIPTSERPNPLEHRGRRQRK